MNRLAALITGVALFALPAHATQEASPKVRTVLFFSPSCPHCHEVITNGLPPIVERFGESLTIVVINVQSLEGQRLFQAAGRRYGIPAGELGVPLLAVADHALVGSYDIPNQLPGIVEEGLASGGIDWPPIDGLTEALAASGVAIDERPPPPQLAQGNPAVAGEETAVPEAPPEPQDEASPQPLATDDAAGSPNNAADRPRVGTPDVTAPAVSAGDLRSPEIVSAETTLAAPPGGLRDAVMDLAAAESTTLRLTPWQKFAQDPGGNSIALIVLFGMIASVVIVIAATTRSRTLPKWPGAAVAILIGIGLVVAAYLSWVELTYSEAVCGPVGDCNAVQQSPYARLFGVLPVGILGLYGYSALGLGWLLRDRGPARWNRILATGLWLLALAGTLFSIYLTALEPFVIGATCMWCVTSAVVMTLLLWAATPAAVEARKGE
jgi:uncharacterized membrane protein